MIYAFVVGRLAGEPELRTGQSGNAFCKFRIASQREYSSSSSQDKPPADFFDCVAFKKTAEHIANSFSKGDQFAFRGTLRNNTWEDDSGKKQTRAEFVVDRIVYDACNSKRKSADKAESSASEESNATTVETEPEDYDPFAEE